MVRFLPLLCLLFLSLVARVSAQDIRITEFMASNTAGVQDEEGDPSGWIEIWYNAPPSTTRASLSNWRLVSDGNSWTFPAVELSADERLLVWASGKNRRVVTAPLHTSFTLPKEGGSLTLVRSSGTTASSFANYPAQADNVSYGRDTANFALVGFYTSPTPGEPNNFTGDGVAKRVLFSASSRTFTGNFQLTLSQETPHPDAVIRYTTNGTAPISSSPLYTGPLTIGSTQQIRARVFQPGLLPGQPETHSYMLLSASTVNFSGAIPLIVVSTFGATIPDNGDQPGFMWVFEPGLDGRARLSDPPALVSRIVTDKRGSSTLGNPKFNLNIETRRARDEEDRDVPLLGMPSGADWVLHAPYNFDRALVRNPLMYALSNIIGRYAVRNEMAEVFVHHSSFSPLAFTGSQSGDYFGAYNVLEKIRRSRNRLNLERMDMYDNGPEEKTGGYIVKVDRRGPGESGFSTPRQGLFTYFYRKEAEMKIPQRAPQDQYLLGYLTEFDNSMYNRPLSDPINGYRAYLDLPAAIDHHLLNVWPMNVDALRLSGYLHKDRGGKIIYGPIWDFDRAMESTDGRDDDPRVWRSQTSDMGTDFFNYTWWNRIFNDIEFYQQYIDRWVELRRGPFSQASLNALLDSLNASIGNEAVSRDLARWGMAKRSGSTPYPPFKSFPGTQQGEIDRIKDWMQERALFMESQWVAPVTISPNGGNVAPGTTVTMTGPAGATIYYTVDGGDPRPPGGNAPPTGFSQTYTGPIVVDATTRIRARAFRANHFALTGPNNPPLISRWSGPTNLRFSTDAPASPVNLLVTEIHYHPSDPTLTELGINPDFTESAFEFLELRNIGSVPIDLGDAEFTEGIRFSFTEENAVTLAPGAYLILSGNPDAFRARYGDRPNLFGPFSGDLSNAGERLVLLDAQDQTLLDFTYSDTWHPESDGPGNSLVIVDHTAAGADLSAAASWRHSAAIGGSPGADEPAEITVEHPAGTELIAGAAGVSFGTSTPPGSNLRTFTIRNTGHATLQEIAAAIEGPDAASFSVETAPESSIPGPHGSTTVVVAFHPSSAGIKAAVLRLTSTDADESPFLIALGGFGNTAPLAVNDTFESENHTGFELNVLANDSDPDGDELTLTEVMNAVGGVATINATGDGVMFTPAEGFTGAGSFSYTVADEHGALATAAVTLRDTTQPALTLPANMTVGVQAEGGVVNYPAATATDAVTPSPVIVYSTASGSHFPIGTTVVTVTASDLAGNQSEGQFSVTLRRSFPVASIVAARDSAVPGAGAGGPAGIPAGAVWKSFGEPGVDDGVPFYLARFSSPSGGMQSAIFGRNRRDESHFVAKSGDDAPGVPGAKFQTFREPLGSNGTAFLATMRRGLGGVSPRDNQGLWSNVLSGETGELRLIARKSAPAPGIAGATYKGISAVAVNDGERLFWTASLKGGGVNKSNNIALFAQASGDDGPKLLLRKGQTVTLGASSGQVKSFLALQAASAKFGDGVKGSPTGFGAGRTDGGDRTGVFLTLKDKRRAIVMAAIDQSLTLKALTGDATVPGVSGARWDNLSAPVAGGSGIIAFRATLQPGPGGVSRVNAEAIFAESVGAPLAIAARQGDAAPGIAGVTFASFSDPYLNADGDLMFFAELAGAGVNKRNDEALYWRRAGAAAPELVARKGNPAPEAGGALIAKFTGAGLPQYFTENEARGPVFTAQLRGGAVTKKSNAGLWATDRDGSLRLLARTGSMVQGKTLRSISAFRYVLGSPMQARSAAFSPHVIYRATFTDQSQAIVQVIVP